MKYYFYLIIFLSCFKLTILDCIPNKNCMKNRGECIKNICHCYEDFWTLKTNDPNISNEMYCNYERKSRFEPLILEFFFPGIGHLIMKKYKLCIIKLFFLFTPIILIIIGYYTFKAEEKNVKIDNNIINKNEEELKLIPNENNVEIKKDNVETNNDSKDNKKELYYSDEGSGSGNVSWKMHTANHNKIPITCFQSFLIFLECIFIICFLAMYIMDLIKYGFAFYRDDNNVPFSEIL